MSRLPRRLFIAAVITTALALLPFVSPAPPSASHSVPSQTLCASPPSGLVSWWPGDGNAIEVVSGNNAALRNGATYAPGTVGQAFSLDGVDDFVNVADNATLEVTSQFTLEAWIKPNDLSDNHQIISKFGSAGNWAYQIGVTGPSAGSLRSDISGNGTNFDTLFAPANLLTPGEWAHVATTFNAGNWKLYVNGVEVASKQSSITSIYSNGPTTPSIGRDPVGYQYFPGLIDEPSIYNRALSGTEIQAIYNAGTAGKCKPQCTPLPDGMVGWWTGDGNANDIIGGHNGTLQSGATFGPARVGQGFQLQGKSYISVPTDSSLNLTRFTVEAWIKPSSSGNEGFILDKSAFFSINYFLSRGANGTVYVDFWDNGHHFAASTSQCQQDTWCHVAGTYDGSTIKLYFNGVLEGTQVYVGTPTLFGQTMRIGQRNDDTFPFQGLIDEVGIYNRALGESEIQAIYHSGSAGKCRTFADNFNRSDGEVGNGWSSWWGPQFDDPNIGIMNGELVTHGYPNFAGGVFRTLPVTFPLQFSFDFRTTVGANQCSPSIYNEGGWLIAFNADLVSTPPPWSAPKQIMFSQYAGSRNILRTYRTTSGDVTDSAPGLPEPVPGQRDYRASPAAHIEGVINQDLSTTISIHYNDGQIPDPVVFSFGPATENVASPPGSIFILSNSSCNSSEHIFDMSHSTFLNKLFSIGAYDARAFLSAVLQTPKTEIGQISSLVVPHYADNSTHLPNSLLPS